PLFGAYYFFLIGVLLAYVSLAIAYANIKKTDKIWLFYVWTFIIAVYTFRDEIMFNMFSAVLLSFIAVYTYERYKENKNKNTLKVFLAFFSLFLFHALIVPQQTFKFIFVARQLILLMGLGLLLDTLLRIHYGRKKK
ncbi:MAG TPA: hypothetical protein VKE88_02720, partial [Candidatus Nanoarchaeia archaeon]|nr:hypothetical protein [Candidatus Nanoarchaeia archaeon]